MPPAAVLLDNDGVLLDSEAVWTRAERDLYEAHGVELTLAHKHELVGTSPEAAGEIMARRLDRPGRNSELVAELHRLVDEELERGVEPMPGARALVSELRGRGVPVAVVSNSRPSFVARALELAGMGDRFDAVVSAVEAGASKPAPEPYLAACERLGVEASPEVVALEDSPTGVASARAAGLTVIGVPSVPGVTLEDADWVTDSLRDRSLRERLGLGAAG